MSVASVLAGERLWWVEQGDCLAVLATLPDASVDAVVTDPTYGIFDSQAEHARDLLDILRSVPGDE